MNGVPELTHAFHEGAWSGRHSGRNPWQDPYRSFEGDFDARHVHPSNIPSYYHYQQRREYVRPAMQNSKPPEWPMIEPSRVREAPSPSSIPRTSSSQTSTTSPTKPKKFTWRSGYNIFFRLERERLLKDQDDREFTEADIERIIAQQILDDKKPPKKRVHRKTHGKIGFAELAKVIANKWKKISPEAKAMFNERAAFEKEVFQQASRRETQPTKGKVGGAHPRTKTSVTRKAQSRKASKASSERKSTKDKKVPSQRAEKCVSPPNFLAKDCSSEDCASGATSVPKHVRRLVTPGSDSYRPVVQPSALDPTYMPCVTEDFLVPRTPSCHRIMSSDSSDFGEGFVQCSSQYDVHDQGEDSFTSDKPESPDEALEMSRILASYER